MTDSFWKGKRVIVFWNNHARNNGYDWPSFRVLDETDEGLFCIGVDAPDGCKHGGTKVFIPDKMIGDIFEWKEEPQGRNNERFTIEAFKAAANTLLSDLARKWDAEGTRCGEEGRNSDEEWDTDGDEWRERRAVYFECAEELKDALRKLTNPADRP